MHRLETTDAASANDPPSRERLPVQEGSDPRSNKDFHAAQRTSPAAADAAVQAHYGALTIVDSKPPEQPKPHELTLTDKLHNLFNIGETMAAGVKDAAVDTALGIAHGTEELAVGAWHGAEKGASWAAQHPGETAAIAAVGALAIGAEIATGGAATLLAPALEAGLAAAAALATSSATATTLAVVGIGAAGIGTTKAAYDVYEGGELSTLMNQQNMTPEQVAQAQQKLKTDTGGALLGDTLLGAGLAARGLIALNVADRAVVLPNVAEGTKSAQTLEGAANAAKSTTGDTTDLAKNIVKPETAPSAPPVDTSSKLLDGKLKLEKGSVASSNHVEVRTAQITHADGTTDDVFFHSEEMEYGKISPEKTAVRLAKEQASAKLNKIIGFENSYPESQPMSTVIDGKINHGWVQEAAGKPLESELKERALAQFGSTSQMQTDVAKILDSDPALAKQVEDATVERLVFGDHDIGAKNLGISAADGKPVVRNFDMGEAFSDDSVPQLSSYQMSLTTIGLQNAMSGRALSPEMTQTLSNFVERYSDSAGVTRLSEESGISANQASAVVSRARWLAEHKKMPEVSPQMNAPENISWYQMMDNLKPRT